MTERTNYPSLTTEARELDDILREAVEAACSVLDERFPGQDAGGVTSATAKAVENLLRARLVADGLVIDPDAIPTIEVSEVDADCERFGYCVAMDPIDDEDYAGSVMVMDYMGRFAPRKDGDLDETSEIFVDAERARSAGSAYLTKAVKSRKASTLRVVPVVSDIVGFRLSNDPRVESIQRRRESLSRLMR